MHLDNPLLVHPRPGCEHLRQVSAELLHDGDGLRHRFADSSPQQHARPADWTLGVWRPIYTQTLIPLEFVRYLSNRGQKLIALLNFTIQLQLFSVCLCILFPLDLKSGCVNIF